MVIEHEHNLLTLEGYFNRFYEIKGAELTDKKAWEELEKEYDSCFGLNRYSSYPSFKSNKWKYLNKILGKPKKVTKGYLK